MRAALLKGCVRASGIYWAFRPRISGLGRVTEIAGPNGGA